MNGSAGYTLYRCHMVASGVDGGSVTVSALSYPVRCKTCLGFSASAVNIEAVFWPHGDNLE